MLAGEKNTAVKTNPRGGLFTAVTVTVFTTLRETYTQRGRSGTTKVNSKGYKIKD